MSRFLTANVWFFAEIHTVFLSRSVHIVCNQSVHCAAWGYRFSVGHWNKPPIQPSALQITNPHLNLIPSSWVFVMLSKVITLFFHLTPSPSISPHQKMNPKSNPSILSPQSFLVYVTSLSLLSRFSGTPVKVAVFIVLHSSWPTRCKVWHCNKGAKAS